MCSKRRHIASSAYSPLTNSKYATFNPIQLVVLHRERNCLRMEPNHYPSHQQARHIGPSRAIPSCHALYCLWTKVVIGNKVHVQRILLGALLWG